MIFQKGPFPASYRLASCLLRIIQLSKYNRFELGKNLDSTRRPLVFEAPTRPLCHSLCLL